MTPDHSTHSVLQLHSPFPLTGLSRVGSAARAVREGLLANASNVIFTARQDDVHRLLRRNVRAVVLHDDASEYFALRAAAEVDGRAPPRRAAAGHPPLRGSMGGFYTAGEVRSEFARLASEYPAWVGAPAKVGSSRNGRDLWVSCVGTNQGRCLADRSRPTVLYTALVHAREPATVMCLVQFLRSLLSSAAAGGAEAALLARLSSAVRTCLTPLRAAGDSPARESEAAVRAGREPRRVRSGRASPLSGACSERARSRPVGMRGTSCTGRTAEG